jgi:hypothetical protein
LRFSNPCSQISRQLHFHDLKLFWKSASLLFVLYNVDHRLIGKYHQAFLRSRIEHKKPERIGPDLHQFIGRYFTVRCETGACAYGGDNLIVIRNGVKFALTSALKV